jgi:protein-S-isoprenylcysteine O-methyltransferase Ste14
MGVIPRSKNVKETVRYIIGYIFGFAIFIVLIPFGFFKLSRLDYGLSGRVILHSDMLRYIFSLLIFVVGAYFAIWSNIFLIKIGKGGPVDAFGVSISPKTRKLVTIGPYRYSRNPMVFGAFSLYLSIVLFLNSIIGLICLILFIVIMIIYLKLSEEKRLLKDFGDEYIDYKNKVSMIFPIKRIRK